MPFCSQLREAYEMIFKKKKLDIDLTAKGSNNFISIPMSLYVEIFVKSKNQQQFNPLCAKHISEAATETVFDNICSFFPGATFL